MRFLFRGNVSWNWSKNVEKLIFFAKTTKFDWCECIYLVNGNFFKPHDLGNFQIQFLFYFFFRLLYETGAQTHHSLYYCMLLEHLCGLHYFIACFVSIVSHSLLSRIYDRVQIVMVLIKILIFFLLLSNAPFNRLVEFYWLFHYREFLNMQFENRNSRGVISHDLFIAYKHSIFSGHHLSTIFRNTYFSRFFFRFTLNVSNSTKCK